MEERFGHQFHLSSYPDHLTLTLPSRPGAIRFDVLIPEFHQSHSDLRCDTWNPTAEGYSAALHLPLPTPGIEKPASPLIDYDTSGNTIIHYDILGFTYWMLTRLEEVGRDDLDEHSRFPATSSHAYKHGYLERPLVDEWLDMLRQVIQRQWPNIKLKQHHFEIKVSHDVDRPTRYGYQHLMGLIRTMAGDVLKRGDLGSALLAPWIRLNSQEKFHRADPFNTFDWIMDQSDAHGLTSAFYFICGRTDPQKDAKYNPEDTPIRHLMRRIHYRGHEVGLHPSFNTYDSPKAISEEAHALWQICQEENIHQQQWGGRMHYLRWRTLDTLDSWADAGMDYDSTLGYADHPGFRCGTCHEFPGFDTGKQAPLNIRVRPLIAMECSVISKQYMNFGTESLAKQHFQVLLNRCRSVNGNFTLLWHNSELDTRKKRYLYKHILDSHTRNGH